MEFSSWYKFETNMIDYGWGCDEGDFVDWWLISGFEYYINTLVKKSEFSAE